MATKRSQRIAIWVIAIALTVGTIGSFIAMVYANDNMQTQQARLDELMTAYQAEVSAYEADVAEYAEEQYDAFAAYASRAKKFDKDAVKELKTSDLKKGSGRTITADSSYSAYYIGWNPSGKIFDSSLDDGTLKEPFAVTPGFVLEGWAKGAVGMKAGGVRQITIPADQAYGETGSGEDIPPNTPLKFIVMVVPFEQPEPSQELLELYNSLQ